MKAKELEIKHPDEEHAWKNKAETFQSRQYQSMKERKNTNVISVILTLHGRAI